MYEATLARQLFELAEEPARRGSPDRNIRLDLRGNFHRAVEVTSGLPARDNARRGK